jgi:hypothetical protein
MRGLICGHSFDELDHEQVRQRSEARHPPPDTH